MERERVQKAMAIFFCASYKMEKGKDARSPPPVVAEWMEKGGVWERVEERERKKAGRVAGELVVVVGSWCVSLLFCCVCFWETDLRVDGQIMTNLWRTHNKKNARGSRYCRVCGNGHAIIRKYGLMICRQCFREKANDIGFIKYQ